MPTPLYPTSARHSSCKSFQYYNHLRALTWSMNCDQLFLQSRFWPQIQQLKLPSLCYLVLPAVLAWAQILHSRGCTGSVKWVGLQTEAKVCLNCVNWKQEHKNSSPSLSICHLLTLMFLRPVSTLCCKYLLTFLILDMQLVLIGATQMF